MSGQQVSRTSSLENNLFGNTPTQQDPNAAREIAALAAELQSLSGNQPPTSGIFHCEFTYLPK
jgi:hypothetical protein